MFVDSRIRSFNTFRSDQITDYSVGRKRLIVFQPKKNHMPNKQVRRFIARPKIVFRSTKAKEVRAKGYVFLEVFEMNGVRNFRFSRNGRINERFDSS